MRRTFASIAGIAAVLVAVSVVWRLRDRAPLETPRPVTGEIPATESVSKDPDAPIERVRVEPATIEVGELAPEARVTRSIRLRNVSDRPVRVLRAVSDCSCTTPTVPHDPIPAGGSVDTEITVQPGTTQGVRFSKRVTFEVEGALPASCTVQGTVGTWLHWSPTTLEAPADGVDAPPGEIAIESAVGTPFAVTEVDPSIESDGPSEPSTRQVVHVDWALWREAGRPMQVTITTDHRGAPPVRVIIRRRSEP